jgi:Lrp/AsnC family transcriptional regulator for asnA, asnC and gidA
MPPASERRSSSRRESAVDAKPSKPPFLGILFSLGTGRLFAALQFAEFSINGSGCPSISDKYGAHADVFVAFVYEKERNPTPLNRRRSFALPPLAQVRYGTGLGKSPRPAMRIRPLKADPRPTIDEVDLSIIEHLQADGRASFREIAESLGLKESQVRVRVHNLIERRTIQIVAVPGIPEEKETVTCIVELNVVGDVEDLAARLAEWHSIPWLTLCAGRADILLSIYVVDLAALLETLGRLTNLPEVTACRPAVTLRIVKRGYVAPGAAPKSSRLPWPHDFVAVVPVPAAGERERTEIGSAILPPVAEWLRTKVDETDWVLIQELSFDGRVAYQALADKLKVNEGTVRKRVKRLVDEGTIKIVAVPTPLVYEQVWMGMASIKVADVDLEAMAEEIASWPDVTWLGIVAGECAIYAEYISSSHQGLLGIVTTLHAVKASPAGAR